MSWNEFKCSSFCILFFSCRKLANFIFSNLTSCSLFYLLYIKDITHTEEYIICHKWLQVHKAFFQLIHSGNLCFKVQWWELHRVNSSSRWPQLPTANQSVREWRLVSACSLETLNMFKGQQNACSPKAASY